MGVAFWVGGLAAVFRVAASRMITAVSRCPMFVGQSTHRSTSGIRQANRLVAIRNGLLVWMIVISPANVALIRKLGVFSLHQRHID